MPGNGEIGNPSMTLPSNLRLIEGNGGMTAAKLICAVDRLTAGLNRRSHSVKDVGSIIMDESGVTKRMTKGLTQQVTGRKTGKDEPPYSVEKVELTAPRQHESITWMPTGPVTLRDRASHD